MPRASDGPDLEALEAVCITERPRAFFTQTLLHNPTGTSTSAAKAHRLLSIAEQYGFPLIEDDVYGDLHEGPAVRLAQLDGLQRVIYIGSFTKLIGPTIRVGYVAADVRLIEQLTEKKLLSVLSGSALLESVVCAVLETGRYRKHLEQLRTRLTRVRRESRRSLEGAGITFDDTGGDGLFLWGRVPDDVDVSRLARAARNASILLAQGALFSPTGGSRQSLRFNAIHSTAPELTRFLSQELARISQ